MDVLKKLKTTYLIERNVTISRSLTFSGLFLRLFNAEKYWDKMVLRDTQLLDSGVRSLTEILAQEPRSRDELKRYQLTLKNTNAKLTERGNFLLALVTLISALGLTKLTDACEWTKENLSGWKLFAIFGTIIFLAVQDTLRVRNRAAIHEELINVIERYLQATSAADTPSPPVQTHAQLQVSVPSSNVDLAMKRLIRMIFSRGAYSALFKAGIVLFGIALIGMSQTALTLYDKEIDAYSSKYRIEAVIGRQLDQVDCPFLTAHASDCLIAQHKIKAVSAGVDLLDKVVRWATRSGTGLLILSIIFFIGTPFARTFLSTKRP